jgi:hypothetical protein
LGWKLDANSNVSQSDCDVSAIGNHAAHARAEVLRKDIGKEGPIVSNLWASTSLEARKFIPHFELDHLPFIGIPLANELASPEDKKLFAQFDALAKRAHAPTLSDAQKSRIVEFGADEKQMYRLTLGELEKLADGKISPADYMTNNIRGAARIAEQNGRKPGSWNLLKPTPQELYCRYVGLAFCDPPMGFVKDSARALAGSAVNLAGTALEQTYSALIKNHAADGFNSNVADVDPSNSITHHYRELMLVGYNSGEFAADFCTRKLDDPKENPGDDRNGYFAGMLGAALSSGKITPSQAAELTVWAYTKHAGIQPPWGDSGRSDMFVRPEDYNFDTWFETYRRSL